MFRAFFHPIAAIVIALACSGAARADSTQPSSGYVEIARHEVTLSGHQIPIVIHRGANANGELEWVVEITELRSFWPDWRVNVAWGRDLDADGLADAWFASDGQGTLRSWEWVSSRPDAWDVIEPLLRDEMKLERKMPLAVFLGSLVSNFTFSGANTDRSIAKLQKMQIDVMDLEIRAERLRRIDQRNPLLAHLYKTISAGWGEIADTAGTTEIRNQILWGVADVVAVLVGGTVVRVLALPAKWLAPRIAETGFGQMSEAFYQKYLSGVLAKAKASAEAARHSLGTEAAVQSGKALGKLTASQMVEFSVRGLHAERKLMRAAKRVVVHAARGLKGGLKEMPYIGATSGLQVAIEVALRRETIFHPNPVVLGENIVGNKDLMQNVSFMTLETLIFAGVTAVTPSLAKRMIICGAFAVVNSTTMGWFIKGNMDPKRAALDAGWEASVGNAQVQIDLAALTYFHHLAQTKGNPKLRLLGYGVVLLTSTANYAGYGIASQAYEKNKNNPKVDVQPEPQIELVPIYAMAGP